MKVKKIFNKPQIIGITGDTNSGKSNLLYHIIENLNKYSYSLYTYGLRKNVGGIRINSVEELEQIENSIIILDEFFSLLEIDNRKKRKLIERTLRLINHNNNVLLLCGIAENYKKFISGKLSKIFFGKSTIDDFINGSKIKKICLSYRGSELGSSMLNLRKSEFILWDGKHYEKLNIPYLKKYDTKKDNPSILKSK